MMWILRGIALRIVRTVAKKATPEIREELIEYVKGWESKALKTPNKWDDILVDVVKGILVIKEKPKC